MGLVWGQSESFREEVIRLGVGRSFSGSYLEDRRTAHFGRREQEAGVRALAAERFERRLVIVWLVRCLRDSLLPASDAARLLPDARARPSSAPQHLLRLQSFTRPCQWGPRHVLLGTIAI